MCAMAFSGAESFHSESTAKRIMNLISMNMPPRVQSLLSHRSRARALNAAFGWRWARIVKKKEKKNRESICLMRVKWFFHYSFLLFLSGFFSLNNNDVNYIILICLNGWAMVFVAVRVCECNDGKRICSFSFFLTCDSFFLLYRTYMSSYSL